MNKIFVGIIIITLVYGLSTGKYEEMANSILALPDEGLKLVCILVFSATFCSGIMMIMYDSGLIDHLAKDEEDNEIYAYGIFEFDKKLIRKDFLVGG